MVKLDAASAWRFQNISTQTMQTKRWCTPRAKLGARRVDGRVFFGPWKIEGLQELVFRCSKMVIFKMNMVITPLLWGSNMLGQFPL